MMNKLRLTYGLHWNEPASTVIAKLVLDIVLCAICVAVIVATLFTAYSWYQAWNHTEEVLKKTEAERLKYELVIVECLNDRSIKINGEYRGC